MAIPTGCSGKPSEATWSTVRRVKRLTAQFIEQPE
jgi:hypothetical protein